MTKNLTNSGERNKIFTTANSKSPKKNNSKENSEPFLAPTPTTTSTTSSSSRGRRQVAASAACCAIMVAAFYAAMAWAGGELINRGRPAPKSLSAPLAEFSEARAMTHVEFLASKIGERQEGSRGLLLGGEYLREQVHALSQKAGPKLRFEVNEARASGSFNLHFLKHHMAMAYVNLTNLAVRISAADGDPGGAAVLVNGHYDSSLGSQGAADCASCVAVMLETMRQILDSDYVPPAPLVFLFNSGEEVFSKAAHGFVTTSAWARQVGAIVNLEAAGTALPDLVAQSGPGSWPMRVYAESAVHPSGTVVAQDVFPHVPGDTDYRIFARDAGDVPGLDSILLLDGYFYHTRLDSPENLMPGALQTRGDNLLPLMDGFARAPELMTQDQRDAARWREGGAGAGAAPPGQVEATPVFFDLFGRVMVYYTRQVAVALHYSLPGVVLLAPHLASTLSSGESQISRRYANLFKGMGYYAASWLLAVIFPVLLAITRCAATGAFMSWYANRAWAFAMFIPASLAGLLAPHVLWAARLERSKKGAAAARPPPSSSAKGAQEWAAHWGGCVGANAALCLVITIAGGGSGYFFFWWAVFLLPALSLHRQFQKLFGPDSPLCLLGHMAVAAVPTAYSISFAALFLKFLSEKAGASGTWPLPFGPYLADVLLATLAGAMTAMCAAPIAPIVGRRLSHPHAVRALLYLSILVAALASRQFPYSGRAPKRVIVSRLFWTQGEAGLLRSEHLIVAGDANDATFLPKHSRQLARALGTTPNVTLPSGDIYFAPRQSNLGWYPVSDLTDRPLAAPAPAVVPPGTIFPTLRALEVEALPPGGSQLEGGRRIHLELNTGSLTSVWASVFNVTGPLVTWSLADGKLPPTERSPGGPPSYMLHLAGGDGSLTWRFWIQAGGPEPLTVQLAVMDHAVDEDTARILSSMPAWTAVTATSSYLSSHHF